MCSLPATPGLKALLADPGHATLSPQQFSARFGPSADAVAAVTGWAAAHGLRVDNVSANGLLVNVSGSNAALGSALNVAFRRFQAADGSSYVSSTGTASLPSSVASQVTAILGLSDLGRAQVDLRRPSPGTLASSGLNFPASYSPQDLGSLYHAPSAQTGAGQTVSVIAEGDLTQPRKDLTQFESRFGLPAVTWNQINVGTPTADTSGDDEWDLDTQYSTGFAPGVSQVNVYVGSSLSDADIVNTINRRVTRRHQQAGQLLGRRV